MKESSQIEDTIAFKLPNTSAFTFTQPSISTPTIATCSPSVPFSFGGYRKFEPISIPAHQLTPSGVKKIELNRQAMNSRPYVAKPVAAQAVQPIPAKSVSYASSSDSNYTKNSSYESDAESELAGPSFDRAQIWPPLLDKFPKSYLDLAPSYQFTSKDSNVTTQLTDPIFETPIANSLDQTLFNCSTFSAKITLENQSSYLDIPYDNSFDENLDWFDGMN